MPILCHFWAPKKWIPFQNFKRIILEYGILCKPTMLVSVSIPYKNIIKLIFLSNENFIDKEVHWPVLNQFLIFKRSIKSTIDKWIVTQWIKNSSHNIFSLCWIFSLFRAIVRLRYLSVKLSSSLECKTKMYEFVNL